MRSKHLNILQILGSHTGGYEDYYLLRYKAV
jgi:hypothetical protein